MPSEKGSAEKGPARAPRPIDAPRAAIGAILVTGLVCLAGSLAGKRSGYAMTAQVLVTLAGAGILGADGEPDSSASARTGAKWIGAGALAGGGCALAVIGLARATHALASVSMTVSMVGLGIDLLGCVLLALRDELLLRGLVLRVAGRHSRVLGLAACGLASAAWAVGGSGASGVPITAALVEALLGVFFGTMWLRERGAFMAVSAHVAWLFATTGGPVVLRATPGFWGGSDGGPLSGACAAIVLLLACAAAVAWSRRETSIPAAPVG